MTEKRSSTLLCRGEHVPLGCYKVIWGESDECQGIAEKAPDVSSASSGKYISFRIKDADGVEVEYTLIDMPVMFVKEVDYVRAAKNKYRVEFEGPYKKGTIEAYHKGSYKGPVTDFREQRGLGEYHFEYNFFHCPLLITEIKDQQAASA